jgi:hypothetical protein
VKDGNISTATFAVLAVIILATLLVAYVGNHQEQIAAVLDGLSTDAQAMYLAGEQGNTTLLIVMGALVCLGVPFAAFLAVAVFAITRKG